MAFTRNLTLGLIFGFFLFSSLVSHKDTSNFNSSYTSSVVAVNGGGQNNSVEYSYNPKLLELKALTGNRHEILIKFFPDWEERINYQKKQEKFYRSGLARITEAKRLRLLNFTLTKQEQDAFDYFNGENFYKYHQNIETPPNIYDSRWSFLSKIEKNKTMRENFLKSYNRRLSEN